MFGSVCYTHIPQERRNKLDKRAEVGILVGYSEITKGYRVYNVRQKKIIVSRDVKIDENQSWNWEMQQNTSVEAVQQVVDPSIHHQDILNEEQVFEDSEHQCTSEELREQVNNGEEDDDNISVRGYRSLEDIYARCNVAALEPNSCYEALQSENWRKAMEEELRMIEKNGTWVLVNKPAGKKILGVKWVFKLKMNADGSVNRHKARLVVKGYSQEIGIDVFDTFAPVARLDTIRLLIAITAQRGWFVYQMNVKLAFLNGYLNEKIHIARPEGFEKASEGLIRVKASSQSLVQQARQSLVEYWIRKESK